MHIQRVRYRDIEHIPQLRIRNTFKESFSGSSPAPFIGRFGYPNVHIGVLSPQFPGDTTHYDSPQQWSRQNTSIGTIASWRYELVNSRTSWNIHQIHQRQRFLDICQEVGMASRPVDIEMQLQRIPTLDFRPEQEIIPFGPQAEVKTARVTSNPRVDRCVEKVVSDSDFKAAPALMQLYQKGFEENFLTKLLSVGTVGVQTERKMVPTRWSITAVDDTIGKKLITEIKDFPVGDYQLYFGGGWGNYYLVLFFPEVWSFELFETYLAIPVNPWSPRRQSLRDAEGNDNPFVHKNGFMYSTDYEGYEGRKEYAEETAGGYYASRLPVLERMKTLKRQQAALVFRFITSEYNIPLGVWVCREATRKSLQEKPLVFATEEEMLQYAKGFVTQKFQFNGELLMEKSKLFQNKKRQKKLTEFTS